VATDKSLLAQSQGEAARIRALLSQGGSTSNYGVAVRAPASGSILSVLNESEGVIAEGTPLVTIGDPGQIEAVIDLLSRDAVQVKPGAKVEFSQWGGNEPLVGKVKLVEPFGKLKISALGIEEQRVNVIIAFDNLSNYQAARLGHGYQVEATIVLWSENNVLRVPIGALYRGADGAWNTFVVEDGKAQQKTLKIGQINDEYGQVLSGLDEDDLVIVNPSGSLGDGTRVQSRSNSR
jgi:HlyD family secretion protein